jgi:hypothetical protein
MAQLQPKVRPAAVLATTEAIEFTPTALSKLVALLGFAFQLAPIPIAISCAAGRVLPDLVALASPRAAAAISIVGRWYRPVAGHGLSLVVVAVVGALVAGPGAAAGFLIGTAVGGAVNMLVDFVLMRRVDPAFGQPLSSTERYFLEALRLHAEGSGQRLEVAPDAVRQGDAWRAALDDYAAEHPKQAKQSVQA